MQRAEKSIRVEAPVAEAYNFWRNFENLPKFMQHVKEVRPVSPDGSLWRWTLKGPFNSSVEFTTRITEDFPGRSIGWNSVEGTIGTSGVVGFKEIDRFTEVHVLMQWFDTPGGAVGEALGRILQNPEQMLWEDLLRYKETLERRVVRQDVQGSAARQESGLI